MSVKARRFLQVGNVALAMGLTLGLVVRLFRPEAIVDYAPLFEWTRGFLLGLAICLLVGGLKMKRQNR
jgi:hypothetical protein